MDLKSIERHSLFAIVNTLSKLVSGRVVDSTLLFTHGWQHIKQFRVELMKPTFLMNTHTSSPRNFVLLLSHLDDVNL
jgi:hypothetical protein